MGIDMRRYSECGLGCKNGRKYGGERSRHELKVMNGCMCGYSTRAVVSGSDGRR